MIKKQRRTIQLTLTALALSGASAILLSPATAQSRPDGQAVFQKRCAGCHALDADHEGPRLRGVVGRVAGKVKTFI